MKLSDLIAKWEAIQQAQHRCGIYADRYELSRGILADLRALELIPSEVREAVERHTPYPTIESDEDLEDIILILNHVAAQCAKGEPEQDIAKRIKQEIKDKSAFKFSEGDSDAK